MPPKKKSVKKTKKIKKAKLQKEQKVKLFADFDVLGEEKKENESTSLSPDIQNDNIILKLEDDESDKNSPDVSAHTSHIEATEVIKENDSEETVELSLEPKTQGEDDEDDEDWETVKPKKSKKKKMRAVSEEYDNIAKLYSYKGHERDKKSINLIYNRYKFYEKCHWDAQQIREQLHIKEKDKVKISQKYYNVEDILPQDETYKEFYILFSSRNEVLDDDTRPGTPRFVISSSTGDVYFTNHYDEFINVKTGKKFK